MDNESAAAVPASSEHMDRWSRNERLYETLKSMGLYVSPIPESDDPTKIRYMIVAADLPPAEGGARTDDAGRSPQRPRGNVVDFPFP
jgi:hypothetical protein